MSFNITITKRFKKNVEFADAEVIQCICLKNVWIY